MTKKEIQESLCKLYLRLNGYLVTNLIIHSGQQGNSDSEIDIVGVRFPYHEQEDRGVSSSDFLEFNNERIEVLIAEIKSGNQALKYNKGLRKNKGSISKLIRWIGIFNKKEFNDAIDDICSILDTVHRIKSNSFIFKDYDLESGRFRIRFIFFAIDKEAS